MLLSLSLICFSLSVFFVALCLTCISEPKSNVYQCVLQLFPAFAPFYILIALLGRLLYPAMTWKKRDRVKKMLWRAGHSNAPVEIFHSIQVLSGVLAVSLVSVIFFYLEDDVGFLWVLVCSAGWSCGTMLPSRRIREQSRDHRSELVLHWPDFIDLLVICLHSGMGFDSALRMTVDSLPDGALKKEWKRYFHDLQSGHAKHEALSDMGERLALPSINQFVSSVIYSEKYGSGLIRQMQQQSDQLRMEQTILAEENALKAPVKMLIPLSLCFFPCTFLVVSYPIIKQMLTLMR